MNYSRTIFPELKLFKKEMTERFLIVLREVFRDHPAYPYLDDESKTSIHIDPTYADIQYEGKSPQLFIKSGSYQFSLQDTLNRNMYSEIMNAQGVYSGSRHLKNMQSSVAIIVRSYGEEESSDLADEIAALGIFAAHHMFTQLGINIRSSDVSETEEMDQNNDRYQTVVNFVIEVPWEFSIGTEDGAIDPGFDIGIDDMDGYEGYRRPGVYVKDVKDTNK